jgi:hypothetical protein
MVIKFPKCPKNFQNVSKIYPNWDFWFENEPSGNPGFEATVLRSDVASRELALVSNEPFFFIIYRLSFYGFAYLLVLKKKKFIKTSIA